MTTTTGSTSTILIGQIALDVYDAKAEKIIWRGLASKTIDQKAKPDKQQKNLAKAAEKLLKNYPPPVKKYQSFGDRLRNLEIRPLVLVRGT